VCDVLRGSALDLKLSDSCGSLGARGHGQAEPLTEVTQQETDGRRCLLLDTRRRSPRPSNQGAKLASSVEISRSGCVAATCKRPYTRLVDTCQVCSIGTAWAETFLTANV
jgi:hypothetical protein